jgi:adenine phosphoribosyltransferase
MHHAFDLDSAIRKVPDFPKPGILFYDITSILTNPKAFSYCVDSMLERYASDKPDAVAAIESRGFLFAAPFAKEAGIPLVLVRKKGKLPGKTRSASYALEYGMAEIEVHEADIPSGKRVLLVDDLVATGGTLRATRGLMEAGVMGVFGVVGLPFLNYQAALPGLEVTTLIQYHGE